MYSLLGLGPQQYVISVGVGMASDDGGSRRVDQSRSFGQRRAVLCCECQGHVG